MLGFAVLSATAFVGWLLGLVVAAVAGFRPARSSGLAVAVTILIVMLVPSGSNTRMGEEGLHIYYFSLGGVALSQSWGDWVKSWPGTLVGLPIAAVLGLVVAGITRLVHARLPERGIG